MPDNAIKNRIYEILEPARPGDVASRIFDIGLISLIGLNILALFLESVPQIRESAPELFRSFELFSLTAFTLEYIA